MTIRLASRGTRANVEAANRRHSATLVEAEGFRLMLDCGDDWRGRHDELAPDAGTVAHTHPDLAGDLQVEAP